MKYNEDKEINKYNKGNQNLKRYGMIKRKVRENVKIREESKYPNGNQLCLIRLKQNYIALEQDILGNSFIRSIANLKDK